MDNYSIPLNNTQDSIYLLHFLRRFSFGIPFLKKYGIKYVYSIIITMFSYGFKRSKLN